MTAIKQPSGAPQGLLPIPTTPLFCRQTYFWTPAGLARRPTAGGPLTQWDWL